MSNTPVLIGIGGLLASGKDTVADYLVEHHGFIKIGMSEPLNDALLALDPYVAKPGHYFDEYPHDMPYIRYTQLYSDMGYTRAKEHKEVRRLLQTLGTEVGRDMIDPEVWTNIAKRHIQQFMADGHSVILTGIRFPNERDMISSLSGALVWVDRPSKEPLITPGGSPAGTYSTHSSENTIKDSDFEIHLLNDRTLGGLYLITEIMLSSLYAANRGSSLLKDVSQVTTDPVWPSYDH